MNSTTTYLIDNCGEMVHSWESDYKPSLSVYLLENGHLLRTRDMENPNFDAGGSGGGIEILDWNGTVLWEYTISSSTECQHHDVEYLPNGNILAIIWDARMAAEATAMGRPSPPDTLWSEKILELQPDLNTGATTIVWEWYIWDHLVQEIDSSLSNYDIVENNPQLLDINYSDVVVNDWLHFNGIDYNANLDQIVISSFSLNEILIIDHSTTTSEAASHSGGNSDKGGDILYRWGNPRNHNNAGPLATQKLFRQHNANWIPSGYPDEGKIMVFNNQVGANPTPYSAVNIIDPPLDSAGNYTYTGGAYAPTDFYWTYTAPTPTDFYSNNISGAHRLPNGNTIITEGSSGRMFEINLMGETVWEYINPVRGTGPIIQGNSAFGNAVFKSERYATNYAGLTGQDLVPMGYIETGSTFTCELYNNEPRIEAKALLAGAYDIGNGMMHTNLLDNGLLPTEQPFNRSPWNYTGAETIDIGAFPADVTDWVLVELRYEAAPETIISQRAAFLRNDGLLIDIDGVEGIQFTGLDINQAYLISIKARNHLAVLGSNSFAFPQTNPYDFTNPTNINGTTTQVQLLTTDIYGLYAGDINADGVISVADFNIYAEDSSSVLSYINSDLNLDGNVTIADFNAYLPNSSVIGISIIRY